MALVDLNLYEAGHAIVLAAALLVFSGVFSVFHRSKEMQLLLSTVLLLIISVLALFLLATAQIDTILDTFILYPFSMFFVALFALSMMMINILSYQYSKDYLAFSALFGFVAFGMFIVAMTNSLVGIVLGMELMTLPSAFMVMINGKQFVESAVKLFVLSAVSIGMLVFAVALAMPYDPNLSLGQFFAVANPFGLYLALLSMFLFIAALSFDATLFPFNLWAPDVYTGAPANITAMLAGVNKKVAFAALFEILFVAFASQGPIISMIFQALAIFTMFFGNIIALVQNNVKRLFAYSAISQAGYIALGIAAATQYGIESSIFQIFAHTFMIIGTFAIILYLEERNIKTIQDFNGLGSRNAFAALALTVFMLSMIGIPPLIGFVGKFLLFTSVINSGMIALAAIAILNSFISVYYYARVIFSMYAVRERNPLVIDRSVSTVVVICLLVTLLVGIYPQPLITIATVVSTSLSQIAIIR